MRTVGPIAAWLAVSCAAAAMAQDGTDKRQLDELKTQIAERLAASGAVSEPETFATNGFRIESSHAKEVGIDFKPDGKEFDYLGVTAALEDKCERRDIRRSEGLADPRSRRQRR